MSATTSKETDHSNITEKSGTKQSPTILNTSNASEVQTTFAASQNVGDEMSDTDNRILQFEHEISELIRNDNGCHASFRYTVQGDKVRCKLVTWNPKHRSTFLTHQCEAPSREEALFKILIYVKDHIRGPERSYTVTWKLKTDHKLVTSHFFAYDIYGLLDKFYYDKNKNEFIICQIKLNPES